jgi:signal transduction histidine kinase
MIQDAAPKFFVTYFATPGPLYFWAVLFFLAYATIGLLFLFKAYINSSGIRKNQLKYLFWSSLFGYIGGSANFLLVFNVNIPILNPFGTYAVPLYVLATTYAIIRYRLMDINLAITRTAVFMAVYALVLGIPLLTALSFQLQLQQFFGHRWWVWLWVVCALLSTLAHYANLYFQRRADNKLLQEQRRYQQTLRQAAQGMTLVKDMQRLLTLIVHILTRAVKVGHASVWLLDKDTHRFVLRAMRGHDGVAIGESVEGEHPLIQYLFKEKASIVQEELRLMLQGGGMDHLKPVVEEMHRIGAAVMVPSFVEERLMGFLVMSEKRSGKLYSSDDLQVFEVLASQAALAIENAQFYEDLKSTQAELFQTAKMATLGQMAGGMSHQINNRFHVLTILAGTLKSTMKELDPTSLEAQRLRELWGKTLEILTKVEENAIRGGDIVKTLLRFSRPGKVETKPIPLQEIVAAAKDVSQYKIDMGTIDFIQEWPENLPMVIGNLNQLADSFFNLITNAYDAIQAKKEKLNLPDYRGRIAISGHPAVNGMVSVDIQDNGSGMTKQELEQIFVPFFTTKATAEKGTGLGLFVIKRILEHHGGNIAVSSTPGEGTTFTIFLPAAASEGKQPAGFVTQIG